jgi:hypothetical protein
MGASSDIWQLPGPSSYVRDIGHAASMGRNVAVVLPRYIAVDDTRTDALAVALAKDLPRGERLWPGSDGGLVEALGREVNWSPDSPVTVPELLREEAAQGQTYVVASSDLDRRHREELPNFLRRLAIEAHSLPPTERCTFIVIVERSSLPTFAGNDRSDVTLAALWYWHRISRWDVAAHIAGNRASPQSGVLGEIHTETAVELAKWNLDMAFDLAQSWDGDIVTLPTITPPIDLDVELVGTGAISQQPPDGLLDAWDAAMVDGWHEKICIAPCHRLDDVSDLNRHLWTAQARVLLPWIEIRRQELEQAMTRFLGEANMKSSFATYSRGESVAEIALLNRIAEARIGRTNPSLRDAARVLRNARNQLAHLRPMQQAALAELVRVGGHVA